MELPLSEPFRYRRRVEFRDTDMAGIVHFSVFFTYMEAAEHELLRSVGLAVFNKVDDQNLSWPRVAASCDYRSAIRFEDEIEIEVAIERLGTSSITYRHQIYRGDSLVADGSMTTVCCKVEHGQRPESVPIPDDFLNKLKPHVTG